MIWAIRQLFVPIRYLQIKQGKGIFSSKFTYDFTIPFVLSVVSILTVSLLSISLGVFSNTGLVSSIVNLLSLFTAFFIAALAAVSTFDRKGLDEIMKGQPAVLELVNRRNENPERPLTHRQFICYLFGYLSFISILFITSIYFFKLIVPSMLKIVNIPELLASILKFGFGFLFFFVFWQILVTVLFGIYFLCDRLQFLDDPEV